MPRRGLQTKRASQGPEISTGVALTASQSKQAELLRRRPDRVVVVRLRTKLLRRLERDFEKIYAQMTDVLNGTPPAIGPELERLERMMSLAQGGAERNTLARAISNLTDLSKYQQSRERVLSTLIDKILVSQREGEVEESGATGGRSVTIMFGAGINRGANEPEVIEIKRAIDDQQAIA